MSVKNQHVMTYGWCVLEIGTFGRACLGDTLVPGNASLEPEEVFELVEFSVKGAGTGRRSVDGLQQPSLSVVLLVVLDTKPVESWFGKRLEELVVLSVENHPRFCRDYCEIEGNTVRRRRVALLS